jgi:two-component system NarL family sensor kinase
LLRSLLTHEERQLQGVAHAIHDGFVQYAVGAQMWLQAAEEALTEDQVELSRAVFTARDSIAQSIREARRMIREFRPVVVEQEGIAAGIRSLIADLGDSGIEIQMTGELSTARSDSVVELQVFRICQRVLNHVIRHGKACRATVGLEQEDGFLVLKIAHDGSGCKPDAVPPLRLIWEDIRVRTKVLGGELVIENRPDDGHRVCVRLPLDADT